MLSLDEMPERLRSPKRAGAASQSRSDWFNFYAGFSTGFVEDVLNHLDLNVGASLLDPWLGSGTTGEIAAATGIHFKGYDINPAMLLVAKARTFQRNKIDDLSAASDTVIVKYKKVSSDIRGGQRSQPDPLEQWMQPRSACSLRILESIISGVGHPNSRSRPTWQRVSQFSSATSILYVALFRTLRHFIAPYRSSNPTWIKLYSGGPRVQVSDEALLRRFLKEVHFLQDALNAETRALSIGAKHRCLISRASSTALPLTSNSIDAILSSPPYCTRIDYVRATLPELALIGLPVGPKLQNLRHMMMGTPTIFDGCSKNNRKWGPACNSFLKQVENHHSKASATYYTKYFRQYFSTAFDSLAELRRVLKKSAHCVLVVQNSYYKEILNDLPLIFSEMADQLGLSLTAKMDFQVGRTMAGIHPVTKQYRTDFRAIESVLTFRKT
jgi:hypothetical protein